MKARKLNAKRAQRNEVSNSVSKDDFKRGPLKYVELEDYVNDNGDPKRLYFRPVPPALMIPIQETGKTALEKWALMLEALSWCVVDPESREPIMTKEEWEQWADIQLLQFAIGAILGIEFETTGDDTATTPTLEEIEEMEAIASDPNPFVETIGTDSPTPSTEN